MIEQFCVTASAELCSTHFALLSPLSGAAWTMVQSFGGVVSTWALSGLQTNELLAAAVVANWITRCAFVQFQRLPGQFGPA
jgi:hypothetical protein